MTATQTIDEYLRRAFAPTRDGVAGLAEQLLRVAASAGGEAEFVRVGDRCVCRWTVGADTHEAPVPLPSAAFRALLAQVAALCGAPPHGGEAALDKTTPLRVAFVNTPDKQQLRLTSSVAEPSGIGAPELARRAPETVPR